MADEQLELRPNWSVVAILFFSSAMCLLIAVTTLLTSMATQGAWLVASAAGLLGFLGLVIAVRIRLILTPDGFRYRVVWKGRFVPWNEVRRFEPDVPPLGVYWLPVDRPPMPESPWQWWVAMSAAQARHIPLFGASRKRMVETLNSWLEGQRLTP
ncbi:MAG: DUF2207 domain-containing protein [Chloroflexi bacterium]|nr:MAG: DUF2207 domain-containing protein [Chloroflexota bacterium]TME53106.1 MAG: DUF2207 domain-containing protein [Chloroflexota bacterium]